MSKLTTRAAYPENDPRIDLFSYFSAENGWARDGSKRRKDGQHSEEGANDRCSDRIQFVSSTCQH